MAIAFVLALFSLVLTVYLLRLYGAATTSSSSTVVGKVFLAEAHHAIETPDGTSTGGIGATTPTTSTRYAPTNMKNTLYPGELPGYTGWPRPTSTLAGFFRIVGDSSSGSANTNTDAVKVVVGKNWTCSIHCSHEACQYGGSLFYVRAYGPAILPGQYTDHRNGTYDVTFLPLDEGIYTVEVVLTFSNPPAFYNFPQPTWNQPAYEGYMLPGFPATVSVTDDSSSSSSNSESGGDPQPPLCTMSQLLESGPTSPVQTGRWLVREKNSERMSLYNRTDDITLEGYEEGSNQLGVRMEYRPTKCSLLDVAAARANKMLQQCLQKNTNNATTVLRLILIGDSNIGAQITWAGRYAVVGGHFPHDRVDSTMLLPAMKIKIEQLLLNDKLQRPTTHYQYVVIFNSGLHDIMFPCKSGNVRCGDNYRQRLIQLVQIVQHIPSVLTVFQTSQAAWPKWGVFGNHWPAATKQPMPLTTSFVEYFNEIAWNVMREMNIPIMDSYWLTLSRPDHREVDSFHGENSLFGKMVHAGPQVYSVLVRKWFMMILESVCPRVMEPHSADLSA